MGEAEEFYDVFVLPSDVYDLLGKVLTDLGQDAEFFSGELKKELQPSYFGIFVDFVLLFVADFLKHLIIDLL